MSAKPKSIPVQAHSPRLKRKHSILRPPNSFKRSVSLDQNPQILLKSVSFADNKVKKLRTIITPQPYPYEKSKKKFEIIKNSDKHSKGCSCIII